MPAGHNDIGPATHGHFSAEDKTHINTGSEKAVKATSDLNAGFAPDSTTSILAIGLSAYPVLIRLQLLGYTFRRSSLKH